MYRKEQSHSIQFKRIKLILNLTLLQTQTDHKHNLKLTHLWTFKFVCHEMFIRWITMTGM